MSEPSDEDSCQQPCEPDRVADSKQLVMAPLYQVYDIEPRDKDDDHGDDDRIDEDDLITKSLIDYAWSGRVLKLISNKAKLMESFSWLSTVGGGYSALGERDKEFSARAGALSLGQQLRLAELLGDERLKVMCHLFAALAALQMNNKYFCIGYIRRVVIPLINDMPYRDPIVTNILRHICFRVSMLDKCRINAIENQTSKK